MCTTTTAGEPFDTRGSPNAIPALSLLGRGPAECVFIDDNGGNVAVARSVGIRSIQFESAAALRGDLEAIQQDA